MEGLCKRVVAGLVLMTLALAPVVQVQAQEKKFEKFLVYGDKPTRNHYYISGFMPDGDCVVMDDAYIKDCKEGKSCIRAEFKRECAVMRQAWAGVYWLMPANNWGDMKGGFKLEGAKRLVFWAKGEKGGESITVKMGGIGMGRKYPDSDSASSDLIRLTKEWKEYSINLTGKDLKRIAGGFSWVAHVKENSRNAVFYFDNIYYE